MIRLGVVKLLTLVRFDKATEKGGVNEFLKKGDITKSPSEIIGALAQVLSLFLYRVKSQNMGVRLMKIVPLRDRVLLKRLGEEEKTKGGIIIPDTAKEKPMQGKVVAAGKGEINENGTIIPLEVKQGDTVLIGKYAGTEIKIEGEEHLIVRENEILDIIKA